MQHSCQPNTARHPCIATSLGYAIDVQAVPDDCMRHQQLGRNTHKALHSYVLQGTFRPWAHGVCCFISWVAPPYLHAVHVPTGACEQGFCHNALLHEELWPGSVLQRVITQLPSTGLAVYVWQDMQLSGNAGNYCLGLLQQQKEGEQPSAVH